MTTDFQKLFSEYHSVHETISAILSEGNRPVSREELEQVVRQRHPELNVDQASLTAAVDQAMKDTVDR